MNSRAVDSAHWSAATPATVAELEQFGMCRPKSPKCPTSATPVTIALLCIITAAALTCSLSTSAAPPETKQFSVEAPAADNSVAAELQSFQLRDGFEVTLFASEALGVSNPLSIRWDPGGRMWVLCTWAYPQAKPGDEPDDKIFILEDTDRDGVADSAKVFADKLNMPMGFELGDGGVYLGQGAELLHLRDIDGDDRADVREVLLRGFGTGDTHQNINSFTWGPGGELMFGQGLHAFSRVETPWGIERLDEAGVWRLWPRSQRLDPFLNHAMGPTNPWGTVFDDWGQPFIVSGAGRGIYYLTPAMIRTDHVENLYPIALKNKLCGVDILSGRHLPAEIHGQLAVGHFWTNQVDLFELSDEGAGFSARELAPIIRSTHKSFRPVDVKVGPDGAIYIADWFNPIVGHYQASFRHPDRDKTHGRIWRLTATGRSPLPYPDLRDDSPANVLEQLRSPERWTRYQVKRILADAPREEVTAALSSWIAALDERDPEYEHLLFEALGVFQSHSSLNLDLLQKLLDARDYRARAYAVRAIGEHGYQVLGPTALSFLGQAVTDPHPRVRLEALVALTYLPYAVSIELAMRVLEKEMDPFIEYALVQAVHALKPQWKPMLDRGWLLFDGRVNHLSFLLRADGSPELVSHVRNLIQSGNLAPEARNGMLVVLANLGDPDDLRTVFDHAGQNRDLLIELAAVQDRRRVRPSGKLAAQLNELIQSGDDGVRAAAIRLAGRWRQRELAALIQSVAMDTSEPIDVRSEAIETSAWLGGKGATEAIEQAMTPDSPIPIRTSALRAVARIDLPLAARHAAQFLSESTTDQEVAAATLPILAREGGSEALAEAIGETGMSREAAGLTAGFLNSRGRLDRALRECLNGLTGVASSVLPYDENGVRELAGEATRHGDPARGEQIYHSPQLACTACHRVKGQGGILGPDLSGIGRGLSTEVIVESVLWPTRQIKEGFLSTVITTEDGRILNGYLQKEDQALVSIRDIATDQEVTIARGQIKSRRDAGTIMPDGLTASLTQEELRDLIAYLASLGRE